MPGYDGTGPNSRGPMTGRGGGHCLLKLPGSADEPLSGFDGRLSMITGAGLLLLAGGDQRTFQFKKEETREAVS